MSVAAPLKERVILRVHPQSVHLVLNHFQHESMMQEEDCSITVMLDVNNPWSGPRETTFEEILLHVANHGTYHLGNITTMLRQQNESSLMMDYSLFWYEDMKVKP